MASLAAQFLSLALLLVLLPAAQIYRCPWPFHHRKSRQPLGSPSAGSHPSIPCSLFSSLKHQTHLLSLESQNPFSVTSTCCLQVERRAGLCGICQAFICLACFVTFSKRDPCCLVNLSCKVTFPTMELCIYFGTAWVQTGFVSANRQRYGYD